MFETTKRVALGITLGLPVVGAALPAHAATTDPNPTPSQPTSRYCAGIAQSTAEVRSGQKGQIACFDTFAESAAFAGVTVAPDETFEDYMSNRSTLQPNADGATSATSTTGTFDRTVLSTSYHYNSGGGDYFQLWGTTCDNSAYNLPDVGHDNWIGSTYLTGFFGVCTKAKHFDAPNLGSGNTQIIDGNASPQNWNLTGAMYQTTSSIQFQH